MGRVLFVAEGFVEMLRLDEVATGIETYCSHAHVASALLDFCHQPTA